MVELPGDEIKKRGKSGIMVIHDTRMVELADRTLSILEGVVTEDAAAGAH